MQLVHAGADSRPCWATDPKRRKSRAAYDRQAEEISNFLDRVYYELSNLGSVAPGTSDQLSRRRNLYQVAEVYREAIEQNLKLDKIEVERSPSADRVPNAGT